MLPYRKTGLPAKVRRPENRKPEQPQLAAREFREAGYPPPGQDRQMPGAPTKGGRPQAVPLPARGQIHKRLRQPPQAPHRESLTHLILLWSRENHYGSLKTHNLAIPTYTPSFTS